MGPCLPKPPRSKFIKEKYRISKGSVKVVNIVEYRPTPCGSKFIKESDWISNRFAKVVKRMEYVSAPAGMGFLIGWEGRQNSGQFIQFHSSQFN
jgi:hypothetical protein